MENKDRKKIGRGNNTELVLLHADGSETPYHANEQNEKSVVDLNTGQELSKDSLLEMLKDFTNTTASVNFKTIVDPDK